MPTNISNGLYARKNLESLKSIRDSIEEGQPIQLSNVAGTRKSITDPETRTLKYYEAEYILVRFMNANNAKRLDYMKSHPNESIPLLTTDIEREIGKTFTEKLEKNYAILFEKNASSDFSNNDEAYNLFKEIVVNSLQSVKDEKGDPYISNYFFGENFINYDTGIRAFCNEFRTYTGVGKTIAEEDAIKYILPLSPFDPKYSERQAFLTHGGHILYATLDKLNGSKKPEEVEGNSPVGFINKPSLISIPSITNSEFLNTTYEKAGVVGTPEDRKGLSPLLAYAQTREEISSITHAFFRDRVYPETEKQYLLNRDNQPTEIPERAMKKAINILTFLKDNGYSYTLEKDNNAGQIKASINNTPYNVRILDLNSMVKDPIKDHPEIPYLESYEFVGRVEDYRTDKSYYIRNKMERTNGGKIFPFYARPDGTIAETVTDNLELLPLCYVLGIKPPEVKTGARENSKFSPDFANTTKIDTGSAHSSYLKSYVTANGLGVDVNLNNVYSLRIRSNPARAIRDANDYNEKKDIFEHVTAEEYMKHAVETARTSFTQRMNIPGLQSYATNYLAGNTDIIPAYDNDEQIAETQRTYWEILTGQETILIKPGHSVDEYNRLRNQYAKTQDAELLNQMHDISYEVGVNVATPIEAVESHLKELVETEIGTFEKRQISDTEEKAFNPQAVLIYMDDKTPYSDTPIANSYTREEIFSEYLGQLTDYKPENFLGNKNANNQILVRSVRYNPETEESLTDVIKETDSTVYKNAKNQLLNAISHVPNCFVDENNLENDIKIDDKGIIKYEFYRFVGGKIADDKLRGMPYDEIIRRYNSDNEAEKASIASLKVEKVTGYVGQVFDYDKECREKGWDIVKTNFNSNENYAMIPDKKVDVLPNKKGENKSFPERLRVNIYENQLGKVVYDTVLNDILEREDTARETIGNGHNINKLYYGMDAEHLPYNFEETYKKQGLTDEQIDLRLKHASKYIKLNNDIKEHSDIFTDYAVKKDTQDKGIDNVNIHSTYIDCGEKNRSVIYDDLAGYVDMNDTGTADTQGLKLNLVEGATINSDGSISPSTKENGEIDTEAHSLLFSNEMFKNSKFNDAGRVAMSTSNFNDALRYAPNTGFVQMSFGGWGYDDGYIISKDFADRNPKYDEDTDTYNPLETGDKISDMSGNKGVISLIVDRNIPDAEEKLKEATAKYETAKEKYDVAMKDVDVSLKRDSEIENSASTEEEMMNLLLATSEEEAGDTVARLKEADNEVRQALLEMNRYKAVLFFKDNPNVDIVEAPYSHTSRLNGGTAMDAMTSAFDITLRNDNGETYTVKNGAGHSNFQILPQTAESKTHIYTGMSSSEGRKASSQLAWALNSQKAYAVMREFYGDNDTAYKDFKEYTNAFGIDIDDAGVIHTGFDNALIYGKPRHVFSSSVDETYDKNVLVNNFQMEIDKYGGFLEIPFPIEFEASYGTGDRNIHISTPNIKDFLSKTENKRGWLYEKYGDNPPENTYLLPIMSPRCRASTTLFDGAVARHDFTSYYRGIYEAAVEYNKIQDDIKNNSDKVYDENKTMTPYGHAKMRDLNSAKQNAQFQFNKLARSVAANQFNTKDNIAKNGLMTKRRPDSATSIWSCNPYLPIDTIAMPMDMARKLKLTKRLPNGEHILNGNGVILWRDPILHDSNVRYMEVKIDNSLTGIQINGMMDVGFDGDFDGDTVALVPLKTKEANDEARKLLSVRSNLLNKNAAPQDMILYNDDGTPYIGKDGKTVIYKGLPLLMNDGMDLAAGENKVVNFHGRSVKLSEMRTILESQVNVLMNGYTKPEDFAKMLEDRAFVKKYESSDDLFKMDSNNKERYNKVKYSASTEYELLKKRDDVKERIKSYEELNHIIRKSIEAKKIYNYLHKTSASPEALQLAEEEYNKAKEEYNHNKEKINAFMSSYNLYKNSKQLESDIKNGVYQDKKEISPIDYLQQCYASEKINLLRITRELKGTLSDEQKEARLDKFIAEFSEYSAQAFEHGFSKHTVSFDGVKNHLKSIVHYMNEGGKSTGKPDKLADYAKAIGVNIVDNLDSLVTDNKQIRDNFMISYVGDNSGVGHEDISLDEIKKSGLTYEDHLNSQYASNVKKQATGLSGSISQKGIAALRRDNPEAVLETTYAVTQSVLQVKHNAADAKRKFNYLNGLVNDLWNGRRIAKFKVDKNGNPTPEKIDLKDVDKVSGVWMTETYKNHTQYNNGEKIPSKFYVESKSGNVKPDEFVNMFMAFYTDKEGLGVEPNREYVEEIARLLKQKDKEYIGGINNREENVSKGINFLDTLAYNKSGTLSSIVSKIEKFEGECIFDTPDDLASFSFAPRNIANNIEGLFETKKEIKVSNELDKKIDAYQLAVEKGRIKQVVASDILESYTAKAKNSFAQTAKSLETVTAEKERKRAEKEEKKQQTANRGFGMSM